MVRVESNRTKRTGIHENNLLWRGNNNWRDVGCFLSHEIEIHGDMVCHVIILDKLACIYFHTTWGGELL